MMAGLCNSHHQLCLEPHRAIHQLASSASIPFVLIRKMHAFGLTENVSSLFDAVEVRQITNPGELNAQEADAGCVVTESQGDMGVLEKDTAPNRETITATYAEHDRRVAVVHEAGRARTEGLWSKSDGDRYYGLTLVRPPSLILPYEVMAEIFDWHMLMDGRWTTPLLVCRQWTMVAYSSPRLWSRISVTNLPNRQRYLRGTVLCTDFDRLRLVLSRSRSCSLQLELSFQSNSNAVSRGVWISSSSLIRGPYAAANRIKAVKLIIDDQILRRCTDLVLENEFLPFEHLNATVLPILSSIQTFSVNLGGHEHKFIQSLVNLSPALRHIRCIHSLSAENQGVGLWTKRIESYSYISPSAPCYPLHESPSLRRLRVLRDPAIPLTLPALQILQWSIGTYSALHRITAARLHTLILRHSPLCGRAERQSANSISFPNLRVAIHTWIFDPTVLHMFHTPALEHLSIEYRSSCSSPTALLKLFDGRAHMPRPKSLHLDCTFTDAVLISVLGRLPWLEELKVAGTVVGDTFWEGMAPCCTLIQPVLPPGEHATRVIVPNLKVLLVNYPTGMQRIKLKPDQQGEMVRVSGRPDDVPSRGNWTVKQILAVTAAREQAGYPLRTLAYCTLGQASIVLIGSLAELPNRPKFVSFWCYEDVLTSANNRWDGDW